MSFLQRSVLAMRVLFLVLLASLGVFALASAVGVTHERSRQLQSAHAEAERIVAGNLPAIAGDLWSYDREGLTALLSGMTQRGSLVRIAVEDDKGVVAEGRQSGWNGGWERSWVLPVMAPDGRKNIGNLRLFESHAEIDQNFRAAIRTLLLTRLIEIVGLACILFVIVYRTVARHLHQLAEDVVALDPGDPQAQIRLDRPKLRYDELDTLVDAFNRFLAERAAETTRRTRAEDSLREHMAEIEVILGALSDGVIGLDGECRVRYANAAARTLLGAGERGVDGLRLDELLKVIIEPEGRELDSLCRTVVVDGLPLHMRGNVRIHPLLTAPFDARISAVPAPASGEVAMIFVFTDISAEISKERQIEFQAYHDPLTRLGNRSLLVRDLAREITAAASRDNRLALLCLDLDNFKNINDALGHGIGDVLLRQLAQRLQGTVADSGWVTRHGGDEFIVVMPAIASEEQAAAMADKLMAAIARPFVIEQHELRVTSSVGICLYPTHGKRINELVSNADMAMYEAKRAGRNAYRFYELDLLHRSSERLTMENAMRVALARQQFQLVFQPKTDITTQRIDSLEALLRWPDAPGGPVSPAAFIPVAEDTGMIIELGDWVLREALAAARRLRAELGRALPVAVNVSPVQFRSERLLDTLGQLAAEEPDLAALLEIELTESALSGHMPEVIAKLGKLKALGLRIAIDDFGTGYSSLAYLKNFPIDVLKIDQAFIRDLHANTQDQAIVGSVVQLGKSLGYTIVAEGVEEEAHVAILARLGCDLAQGYWFARPMPEAEVLKRYREV